MASYTFVPGAVAANTPTDFPADFPKFASVTSVAVQTEASGGTASTTSPIQATVVSTVPSGGLAAGQFAFLPTGNSGAPQWQYGSATTTGTVFVIEGKLKGQQMHVA